MQKSFRQLYDQALSLLTTKGYTEANVNSPDLPGRLAKALEMELRDAIRKCFLTPKDTYFDITMQVISQDQQLIELTIYYAYKPESGTLYVYTLRLRCGKTIKRIHLLAPNELPDANQVVAQFVIDQ